MKHLAFITLIVILFYFSPNADAEEGRFNQIITGVSLSTARQIVFDYGYYYVVDSDSNVDMSKISGPTISGAISTNSISASLGLGEASSYHMFGVIGSQFDATYMRRWEDEIVDYSGLEMKFSFMVFTAKASFMLSQDSNKRLSFLSIGVGM